MEITINRRTILLALMYIGIALAFLWWLCVPPTKARELRPLLKAMDSYMATNAKYPTSCAGFVSFTQLTQHFRVYTGEPTTNGIAWEPSEVSRHDFTVMVDKDGYEIFLPVGRMKLISFSSFPVWRYDSFHRHWQKGKIHWSFVGSYWSRN
jgi:hypothetical protein